MFGMRAAANVDRTEVRRACALWPGPAARIEITANGKWEETSKMTKNANAAAATANGRPANQRDEISAGETFQRRSADFVAARKNAKWDRRSDGQIFAAPINNRPEETIVLIKLQKLVALVFAVRVRHALDGIWRSHRAHGKSQTRTSARRSSN